MEHRKMQELQNKIIGQRNNIASTKGVVPDPKKRQFIKTGILGIIAGIGIAVFSKMTRGLQYVSFAGGNGNSTITDGQFAFPATVSTSTNANTLDDYEEGSWTPQLADTSSDGSGEGQAYNPQVGRYTKVGQLVNCWGRLGITDLGTLTTSEQARVVGLPFTTANVSLLLIAVPMVNASSFAITAGVSINGVNVDNTSEFRVQQMDATSGISVLLVSEWSISGDVAFHMGFRV